jgi:hypothetical protein
MELELQVYENLANEKTNGASRFSVLLIKLTSSLETGMFVTPSLSNGQSHWRFQKCLIFS